MNQLYQEIQEQPEVFGRIQDLYIGENFYRHWNRSIAGQWYFTGMGSSLFAAYPAYLHLLEGGFPVHWVDASELLHYGLRGLNPNDTVVFFSQSGESYEVLRILELLPQSRPHLIGITANPHSTMAIACDEIIDILSGLESAVTSTKTHSSMVAMTGLWALALSGHKERFFESSAAFDLLVEETGKLVQSSPVWADRILHQLGFTRQEGTKVIIGRGPAMSTAWHGCLCFYECAKEPFMSFSAGQFRHGPLELALEPMLAIVLALPGRTQHLMNDLAVELVKHSCRVLMIGSGQPEPAAQFDVLVPRFPDELFASALSIVPLELLSYYLAKEKGIEPGKAGLISKTTSRE